MEPAAGSEKTGRQSSMTFDFYPQSFRERRAAFESLRETWDELIGEALPITDEDLFLMLRRARWDLEAIRKGIADLRHRIAFPFNDPPASHAMNYFLAAVKRHRLARQQEQEKAA